MNSESAVPEMLGAMAGMIMVFLIVAGCFLYYLGFAAGVKSHQAETVRAGLGVWVQGEGSDPVFRFVNEGAK